MPCNWLVGTFWINCKPFRILDIGGCWKMASQNWTNAWPGFSSFCFPLEPELLKV